MDWIRVEDDLPTSTGYDDTLDCKLYPFVFIYIQNSDYDCPYAVAAWDDDHEEWFFADYSDTGIEGVTHWAYPDAPQD